MSKIEKRIIDIECKIEARSENPESRLVTGYAAVFNKFSNVLYGCFREKIDRSAFDKTDMSNTVMLYNHNIDNLLARTSSETLKLSLDDVGLRFEFEMPKTRLGDDILELIDRRDISSCSFSFIISNASWIYATPENGLEYDERTILEVSRLPDVSLVVAPAYPDATLRSEELDNIYPPKDSNTVAIAIAEAELLNL